MSTEPRPKPLRLGWRVAGLLTGSMSLVAVLTVSLYLGVRYLESHGPAFAFVQSEVRRSPEVMQRVGTVASVAPAPFGPYHYHSTGSKESVALRLVVVGSRGEAQFDAKATAENGNWALTGPVVAIPLDSE